MTDPKHEPVAWRWPEGEYGEWRFANRAPVWPDLPEGGEVEPLYPAFTVEVLIAQLDALKEENERLKAPSPQADTAGQDGLNEHAFDAARKAYHQTHIGDYGPLRAAIAAYVSALEETFDVERDSLTREIEEYRSEIRAMGRLDYKIVPLVPTREMIDAWRIDQAQGRSLESSYAAMIEASPSPETNVLTQPQLPESGESVEGGECQECGGTGMRDTGGVHPWGEHISVPCDCKERP